MVCPHLLLLFFISVVWRTVSLLLPLPLGALAQGDAVLTLGLWAHPAHGLQEPGKLGLEFEEQLRFCF